ncbi:MAG: type III-A CRISPR-associated protein Csm2 [Lachnospiraceae bacterium]|nr:type III-A CRISPR-associated protein Csm2 [Lachnospiraceae bacterium]
MILDEKTYVDKAEKVILKLSKKKDRNDNPIWITTSKIRNLLAMTADIYNEILPLEEILTEELTARIDYLRVRFIYECGRDTGRDKVVKDFVETAEIIEILKEVKNSRARFILFMHYMEALVAYHKFYGGKD